MMKAPEKTRRRPFAERDEGLKKLRTLCWNALKKDSAGDLFDVIHKAAEDLEISEELLMERLGWWLWRGNLTPIVGNLKYNRPYDGRGTILSVSGAYDTGYLPERQETLPQPHQQKGVQSFPKIGKVQIRKRTAEIQHVCTYTTEGRLVENLVEIG
jgi:hypothetical protein